MIIDGTTFPRAAAKYRQRSSRDQTRFIGGDGNVKVRDRSPHTEELITYEIPRMTDTEKQSLESKIESLAWAGTTFTLTDDYSVARTVRLWSKRIDFEHRLGRYWSAEFTVRVVP